MFGETLKTIIDDSGISLSRISRASGISRSMLYKVIKDESQLSNEKFTQLIEAALFGPGQINELMDAYLSNCTGNCDGSGLIRALNFIENLQRNESRKVVEPVELVNSAGYTMLSDQKKIANTISQALSNYKRELLILNQEKSRIEKHIPESGKNIIVMKNISDLSRKVTNLNDGLLACLRNPDIYFCYTTVPTLNISIYDNYLLVDDILYMYSCDLTIMAYTSNPKRISFFKKIFFERLENSSRYFQVEPLFKSYQEVLKVSPNQSIIFKDNHYYIKNRNKALILDKMLEQDLRDYFTRGAHNVEIHQ